MLKHLFLFCCLFLFSNTSSFAGDFVSPDNPTLTVVKKGNPMLVFDEDEDELTARLIDVFNSNETDTRERWLKDEFEHDGVSIEEKWKLFHQHSFFSLEFKEKESELRLEEINPEEIIVTINTSGKGKLFGAVMAKMRDGEIRGYYVDQKELINLYCFDQAAKYLPSNYGVFGETYKGETYEKSGIMCSVEQ